MARPAASILTAYADLARAVESPVPDAPTELVRAARKAVTTGRDVVLREILAHGPTQVARANAVNESTLRRWRTAGGWLYAPPLPASDRIEDTPGLSQRAVNVCEAAGVTTWSELATHTADEVRRWKYSGPKVVAALTEGLAARGLAWATQGTAAPADE